MADRATTVDVLGILLLVSGFAALQYFLERGEIKQWFDDPGIALCAVWAPIGLAWFAIHALRARDPVLDLRTLRHRNLTLVAIATFALGANLYGSLLVLPLYLQNSLGFTALLAGLVMALRALPTALLSPFSTILLQRGIVSPRAVATFGFAVLTCGTYLLARGVTPLSDAAVFVPAMLVVGVGYAFIWTPLGLIALRGLPPRELGYGSAIFNLSSQIGGSVGIAAITTLQDRRTAFWWDALASGITLRNPALLPLGHATDPRALAARLSDAVAAQAAVLTYRDLLLLLAIPPLVAIPVILFARRTRIASSPSH